MEAFQTKGKHAPSSRREEDGLCGCSIECEVGVAGQGTGLWEEGGLEAAEPKVFIS